MTRDTSISCLPLFNIFIDKEVFCFLLQFQPFILVNAEYLFKGRYVVSNILRQIFFHFFQPAQGKRSILSDVECIQSDIFLFILTRFYNCTL